MSKGDKDTPKLLLDEHVWAQLANILREQGFDVIHVCEIGLVATPDNVIFQYAVNDRRAILTFNARDFIPLAIQYFETETEHYGVIVSNQILRGELQNRVINLLGNITQEKLKNTIRFLQDYK
jgi:predicted nuclease of predicted toxin-antitoxin system